MYVGLSAEVCRQLLAVVAVQERKWRMEVARGAWEGLAPSCCSTRVRASISEGSVRAGCGGEGKE